MLFVQDCHVSYSWHFTWFTDIPLLCLSLHNTNRHYLFKLFSVYGNKKYITPKLEHWTRKGWPACLIRNGLIYLVIIELLILHVNVLYVVLRALCFSEHFHLKKALVPYYRSSIDQKKRGCQWLEYFFWVNLNRTMFFFFDPQFVWWG